jgi:hypothetical protein
LYEYTRRRKILNEEHIFSAEQDHYQLDAGKLPCLPVRPETGYEVFGVRETSKKYWNEMKES